jgi:hypothetical protein
MLRRCPHRDAVFAVRYTADGGTWRRGVGGGITVPSVPHRVSVLAMTAW